MVVQRDSTNGTWCYQAITTEIGALYSLRFTRIFIRITTYKILLLDQLQTLIQVKIPRIDTTSTTGTTALAEFVAIDNNTTYIVLGSNYTVILFGIIYLSKNILRVSPPQN